MCGGCQDKKSKSKQNFFQQSQQPKQPSSFNSRTNQIVIGGNGGNQVSSASNFSQIKPLDSSLKSLLK